MIFLIVAIDIPTTASSIFRLRRCHQNFSHPSLLSNFRSHSLVPLVVGCSVDHRTPLLYRLPFRRHFRMQTYSILLGQVYYGRHMYQRKSILSMEWRGELAD